MPQKKRSEDTLDSESNQQNDKQIQKTEAKAGDNSNAGAASDFIARDNSTVNIGSTINNILSQKDRQLFRLKDLDLKDFEAPYFPTIVQINDIINKFTKHRLLLLSGTHEDKQEIATHIAVKLKRHIKSQSLIPNGISIWKWNSVSDYRGVLGEIRGEGDERTEHSIRIIILPELKPEYIASNVETIKQAIHGRHCYVIATTDNPSSDWIMTELDRQEIEQDLTNISYDNSSLQEAAVQRLVKTEINLGTVEDYLRKQIPQLKTVARIKDFIQWLWNEEQLLNQKATDQKQPLSQSVIDKAVFQAKQDRSATLERWFRQLTLRQQLIVIGVTLFKNLFSNQFFAALERVVEQTWQKKESSLRSLDYSDLVFLGNYCEFVSGSYRYKYDIFTHIDTEQQSSEIEFSQLKIRRPDDAHALFKVAWKTHQRQIISALKEMAQIVEDSVERVYQTSSDWELFGDEFQSQQLRDVIGQTLGEIGLVSLGATNAVQNALLSLAAHNSIEVRDVAAKAIASWYSNKTQDRFPKKEWNDAQKDETSVATQNEAQNEAKNKNQKFYETLHRLYSIAVREHLNSARLADCIGATVAMTISYATLSDSPNHLSKELKNWLNELSESKSFPVRAHLGYHTLAFVVPRHLYQLKFFIKSLAEKYGGLSEDDGLGEAIALSLNQAYKDSPKAVEDLLQSWLDEYKLNLSQGFKVQEQERNRLAQTVALTYGAIECNSDPNSLTAETALDKLDTLLNRKQHSKVRDTVIKAVCNRANKDFSSIESQMNESLVAAFAKVVARFTNKERDRLVGVLTNIYLQQRESLQGGQDFYLVGQHKYPIWLERERPLTALEETLFSWLGNKEVPVGEQLATLAFFNFAKEFEMGEAKFVKNLLSQNNLLNSEQDLLDKLIPDNPEMGLSGLWAWLALFPDAFPTMVRYRILQPDIVKQYQPVIRNILPQTLILARGNNEVVEFLVNKWKQSKTQKNLSHAPDAPELTKLAKFLSPSLWLAKNPWAFFLSVGVFTWIGYSALGGAINGIRQSIDILSSTSPERNSSSISPPPSNSTQAPNTYTPSANPFELEKFPKPVCGDPKPTNQQEYPVSFYPVFIDNSDTNLNRIRAEFCEDARPAFRKKMNKTSIQVASFTSTQRSEEFKAFLATRFGNAEVGEPLVIETP